MRRLSGRVKSRVVVAVVAAALAAGCGGRADESNGSFAVPPYGLSGRILTSTGTPVPGATVLLVRPSDESVIAETTSHADGGFAFLVMDGSYTIEPTVDGFQVSPSSARATVAGGDVSIPAFVARPVVP